LGTKAGALRAAAFLAAFPDLAFFAASFFFEPAVFLAVPGADGFSTVLSSSAI
jgi:hypothetical protein